MYIDFFKYSDKGERAVNEDSVGTYNTDNEYSFVLCDGLGGHGKGEIASQTAVQAMITKAAECGYAENTVASCFEEANKAILEKQERDESLREMKTTGVVLVIKGDMATWGHVGDSRLYYFHRNKYEKRTLDHSVPQMLASTGEIKDKDIRHHEDRNRLLRCIPWLSKKYDVDEYDFNLQSGDSFLLMSDGFWDWVDEKAMRKCLKKGKTAEDTGNLLVELAFANGRGKNMDNLSLIVVKIG